ncbi:DUF6603 domain-containing protein [Streptomyces sp. NPDC090442]|uniref:DUF6603 domain-containing protein n=1 Tax=Streptomyces sp. NPDC090442 TaxID=3365962 RepID=UPI0038273386
MTLADEGGVGLADVAKALGVDLVDVPAEVVALSPVLTSAEFGCALPEKSLALALEAQVDKARARVLLASLADGSKGRKNAAVLWVPFTVGVSDLPVVGPLLPSGVDVGLSGVGVLAASKAFTQPEAAAVNALLSGKSAVALPEPLVAGGAVRVEARLGTVSQVIELRPKAKPKKHKRTLGAGQIAGWWEVSRAVGPVRVERVGAVYTAGKVGVLLDAQVSAGGLVLATRGLGVEMPLKAPHTPAPHLDGLGIGFTRKPVTITGELLNLSPPPKGYRFAVAGMAVIEVPTISVEAVGFYAHPQAGGEPSLFLFGTLGFCGQRGIGPPQFRITKFAAGFGYNSSVREVKLAQMDDFPFMGMLKSEQTAGDAAATSLAALEKLTKSSAGQKAWVSPQPGQVWVAAGLEFVAFEFVTAQALALVEFGSVLTAQVLLHAKAAFPKAPAAPYGQVEVDAAANYSSSTDTFSLDAKIKDGSFLLTEDCHVGGELAVRAWFGRSAHPGDFVFTLGGYYPTPNGDQDRPAHYPTAKRVSLTWQTPVGSVEGTAYLALTPSAFMVGSLLKVAWAWWILSAGFEAQVNALVQWAPFHFEVSVDLKASAQVDLGWAGKPSGEVSISIDVFGPPVGISARFTFWGYEFPIEIGEKKTDKPKPLTGERFRADLLPHATGDSGKSQENVLAVRPLTGLEAEQQAAAKLPAIRRVSALAFSFETHSAVPATDVYLNGTHVAKPKDKTLLDIRPMGVSGDHGATSAHRIKLTRDKTAVPIDAEKWGVQVLSAPVPKALWGKKEPTPKVVEKDTTRSDYYTGVRIGVPAPYATSTVVWKTKAADLGMESATQRPLPLSASDKPAGPRPKPWNQEGKKDNPEKSHVLVIAEEIAGRKEVRRDLWAALPKGLCPAKADDAMTGYAELAGQRLCSEPLFASGWESK